jgi:predicted ATP-dependent serine protease
VFAMTGQGMEDVDNPSELFLSASVLEEGAEGSAVAVIVEGSRWVIHSPLLSCFLFYCCFPN